MPDALSCPLGMKITISKTGSIEVMYENSQGSSQVDEHIVFPSYSYGFRIRDSTTTIHIEISSLNIDVASASALASVPTSIELTVFLDTNRRLRRQVQSNDDNKYFHAAVMGENIDETTSTNTHTNGAIVFSRLRLMQESSTTS